MLVTANGMLGMTACVKELLGGRKYCTTDPAMPIPRPTATATGRLRSRAAMTAAKAAIMRRVKLLESSPTIGAETTPMSPARKVLATQTPAATMSGLEPESDVMAGESTIARTRRPTSVYRRRTVPTTRTSTTQKYTMT